MGHPGTGHFGRWRDDLDGPGSFKSFSIDHSFEQIHSFEHFLSNWEQKVDPGKQKFWEMIENQDENLPISEDLIAADVKLVDIHLNDQPFFRFESRLSAFRCASISWFQVVSQLVSEWYFSDFQ